MAQLEGFGAGKASNPVYVGKPEALINLRIDPQFSPLPRSDAGIERDVLVSRHWPLPGRPLGPSKGDRSPDSLLGKRGLAVEIYPISFGQEIAV
jgi:hypothetical protein